jgi:micrococcal nuclease
MTVRARTVLLRRAWLGSLPALVFALSCRESTVPPNPDSASDTCHVEFVADGDTLRCADGRWIRLLLIDAPEMAQVPYGEAARDWLEEKTPPRRDVFGRELAYLYLADEVMVNEAMAFDGYVVPLVIPPNGRHETAIRQAVASAMAAGRGLWGTWGFSCLPVDFRAGRCP